MASHAPMRILVPVDGSHWSLAAAREVASRPWPRQTQVRILYVTGQAPGTTPERGVPAAARVLTPSLRDTAGHAIEKAVAQFGVTSGSELTVETAVRHGRAHEVIVAEAESWAADLIVMGSRGMSAVERLFLGSVSRAVANGAPCSVEVVRPRAVAP